MGRVQLKEGLPVREVRKKVRLVGRETCGAEHTAVQSWQAEGATEGVELGFHVPSATLREPLQDVWGGVSAGVAREVSVLKAAWKVECPAGRPPEVAVGLVPQGFLEEHTGQPHATWLQGIQKCRRAFLWCPEGSVFMPRQLKGPASGSGEAGRVIALHSARMVHRTDKWSRGDVLQVHADLATDTLALLINQQVVRRVAFDEVLLPRAECTPSPPLEFVALIKGRATTITLTPPDRANYKTPYKRVKDDARETELARMTLHELGTERPVSTFFTASAWKNRIAKGGSGQAPPALVHTAPLFTTKPSAAVAAPQSPAASSPLSFSLSPSHPNTSHRTFTSPCGVSGEALDHSSHGDGQLDPPANVPDTSGSVPIAASIAPLANDPAQAPQKAAARPRPTTAGLTRGAGGRLVYGGWSGARRDAHKRQRSPLQEWKRGGKSQAAPSLRQRAVQAARTAANDCVAREERERAAKEPHLQWQEEQGAVHMAPARALSHEAMEAGLDAELGERRRRARPATASPIPSLARSAVDTAERLVQYKAAPPLESLTSTTPWAGEQTAQANRLKQERKQQRLKLKREAKAAQKAKEAEGEEAWKAFLGDREDLADTMEKIDDPYENSSRDASEAGTSPPLSPAVLNLSSPNSRTSPFAASCSMPPPNFSPAFLELVPSESRRSPSLANERASRPPPRAGTGKRIYPVTKTEMRGLFCRWEAGELGPWGARGRPSSALRGDREEQAPLAWGQLVYREMEDALDTASGGSEMPGVPHALRTAAACLILHRLVPLFKGYASLLMRCLHDVFRAVFTDFPAGCTNPPTEDACLPKSPRKGHAPQPAFIALGRYADKQAGVTRSASAASLTGGSSLRGRRFRATARKESCRSSLAHAFDGVAQAASMAEPDAGSPTESVMDLQQAIDTLQKRVAEMNREHIHMEIENTGLRRVIQRVHFSAWKAHVRTQRARRDNGDTASSNDREDDEEVPTWAGVMVATFQRLQLKRYWKQWQARLTKAVEARDKEIEARVGSKMVDMDVGAGLAVRPDLDTITDTASQWAMLDPETQSASFIGTPQPPGALSAQASDFLSSEAELDVSSLLLMFVRVHQPDPTKRITNFGEAFADGGLLLNLIAALPPEWFVPVQTQGSLLGRVQAWLTGCPVLGVVFNTDHLVRKSEAMTTLFLTRLLVRWLRCCVRLQDVPVAHRTQRRSGDEEGAALTWTSACSDALDKYSALAAAGLIPHGSCSVVETGLMKHTISELVHWRVDGVEPVFVGLFRSHASGSLQRCLLDPRVQAVLTEEVLLLLGSVFRHAARDDDQISLDEFAALLAELEWLDGAVGHDAMHLAFYLAQSGVEGGDVENRREPVSPLSDNGSDLADFHIDIGEFNDAICILSAFFPRPIVSPDASMSLHRETEPPSSPRASNEHAAVELAAHLGWFCDAIFLPDLRNRLPESVWNPVDTTTSSDEPETPD